MEFKRKLQNEEPRFSDIPPEDRWKYHNLQFYLFPYGGQLQLNELMTLATQRLEVLRAVEAVAQQHLKYSDEYQKELDAKLRKLDFKIAIKPMSRNNANITKEQREKELLDRRNDHMSHFILRLAYCLTAEQRQWFIQQEVDLFKFRFSNEGSFSVKQFLQLYEMPCVTVSGEERKVVEPIIVRAQCTQSGTREYRELKGDIFKVYFTDALDLVKAKKVYLRSGYAYVPFGDLATVVVGKFRANLSKFLTIASKKAYIVYDEPRLGPFFKVLTSGTTVSSYAPANSANSIAADMIDSLAKESFPPCMRMMYQHLHTERQIRYHGRLQLGLFLKGIGMSMEEALKFWKTEFSPKTDPDTFAKKYAYNIRHNYGEEGKRAQYTPYTCAKVIMSAAPGPTDTHGCPFKHIGTDVLKQRLKSWNIRDDDAQKIVDFSEAKQYDRACTCFFERSHQLPEAALGQVISHPNQYFEESRKVLTGAKKPGATEVLASQPTRLYSASATVPNAKVDDDEDMDALISSLDF